MNTSRIKLLNKIQTNKKGKYILYWMQQSQRTSYNHALNYAIEQANKNKLPLVVCFGLTDNYPEANIRHYYFMLEGLKEVKENLEKIGAKFILRKVNEPWELALELSNNAFIVLTDKGYMKIQRKWRIKLAKKIKTSLFEVESDLVVPIEITSNKEEYAAYTIRKKINKNIDNFLFEENNPKIKIDSSNLEITGENFSNIDLFLKNLKIDHHVKKSDYYKGGYNEAIKKLNHFINFKLNKYNELKNNPVYDYTSNLSPYLHFGQISSLEIALKIKESGKAHESIDSYLEELVVRRELAFNFCYYNENYDNFKGLKANWIYETLETHNSDERTYIYNLEQWENAETHDEIWNACQHELIITGDMHGYMRMYWGKKILEWSKSHEEAFNIAVYLNNKYALDGRDANSFAGIAWCFGKHDRPWFEREIFGKIRYMNASGLKRKFKVNEYIDKINEIKNSSAN